MKVTFSNSIKRETHHLSSYSDTAVFKIEGGVDSTSFPFTAIESQDFAITTATAPTFSVNLFDHIKAADANLAFIQIAYVTNITSDSQTTYVPLTFQLSIGGVVVGNMSEFQMLNITNYSGAAILLDTFSDPLTNGGTLFIIAGSTTI